MACLMTSAGTQTVFMYCQTNLVEQSSSEVNIHSFS